VLSAVRLEPKEVEAGASKQEPPVLSRGLAGSGDPSEKIAVLDGCLC
jgi:hypothetical protein